MRSKTSAATVGKRHLATDCFVYANDTYDFTNLWRSFDPQVRTCYNYSRRPPRASLWQRLASSLGKSRNGHVSQSVVDLRCVRGIQPYRVPRLASIVSGTHHQTELGDARSNSWQGVGRTPPSYGPSRVCVRFQLQHRSAFVLERRVNLGTQSEHHRRNAQCLHSQPGLQECVPKI